ncbi:putative spermidine/putrescine transport system ATP-binding protein [Blastococcus colisei]|uniref:Putative spermidine/putrescine transport system ATP-binding protein n=1 Tax=Blastococcus colisei TaxID=1564162 RepID=A0A543PA05_9ACTN|nr:ABC transporter ATP-binding protein [Blastococcus colisei]TQN40921.1 putative spermidine/putrescine transport system ATP-binding protein [Blastococcus colisei]
MSGGSLKLTGLTRVHRPGQRPALDDFSLDVPAGSCVAILGPSGSGKSTVLRLTAGLDEPTAGTVRVDGADLAGVVPERRGMAMVFQRPLLFPHLSVRDNVAFADRVRGVPRRTARRRAEEFLELVQLGGYGGRPARALSGGQEQRVALARALAAEPRVLLLDEAFSALDAALREEMHELLGDLRMRLDPTILLVTHDHAEADALADTAAVLDEGVLLQTGPMRSLYARPASLAVCRLLGGRTEVTGVVREGRHESPLGTLELPARVPDGPAVLVVRHEAVTVTSPADGDCVGTVVRLRRRGLRSLVTVEVTGDGGAGGAGTASVDAELGPGEDVPPGATVGLRLPVADRWVVATPAGTTGSPTTAAVSRRR